MDLLNQFEDQQQTLPQNHHTYCPLDHILPAMQIIHKPYSLQPDMILGWKPKMKIAGPIPLNFDNPIIDIIIEQLTSFGKKYSQRMIYLGHRPSSSYKMHEQIKHSYEYKYDHVNTGNYSNLAPFFRKFYSNFESKKTRLFRGNNPTINKQQQILFDSNFQSGNLDAAIKIDQNQYDLFMRIDSNTKGHNQWFNFTIRNGNHKKIKINICNFRKSKTLFQRGMKPYIISKHLSETKKISWVQGGINVKFEKMPLRYNLVELEGINQQDLNYYCLQFQYIFEKENDQVNFAYSPPYTYSDLLKFIKKLSISQSRIKQYIKQNVLCESLSGLSIPLLTITDFNIKDNTKKCILITSRIHPGQSNSNYMLQGFLQFVCGESHQAQILRAQCIFKVIPMMNPDGVVLGNFRTSLCGKDLNRVFKDNVDLLYPQVKYLKELALKLKDQFKERLNLFLDFHGHSIKKNVFIYGPQYSICQSNYYKTRLLPKLISSRTEMFRYYSCLFKISQQKRSTARAVFLKMIPHCYTIQASNSCYYSPIQKRNIDFNPQTWKQMGIIIGKTLKYYVELLENERILQIQKTKKIKQSRQFKKRRMGKGISNGDLRTHQANENKFIRKNLVTSSSKMNINFKKIHFKSFNTIDQHNNNSIQENNLFKDISEQTKKIFRQIQILDQQKNNLEQKSAHQSDRYSQGHSDAQSNNQDLENENLNRLHNNIIHSLEEFKARFHKKNFQKIKSRKQILLIPEKQKKIKEIKQIQFIPCLRKKFLDGEKQINSSQSNTFLEGNKYINLKKTQITSWPRRTFQNTLMKTTMIKPFQKLYNINYQNLPSRLLRLKKIQLD